MLVDRFSRSVMFPSPCSMTSLMVCPVYSLKSLKQRFARLRQSSRLIAAILISRSFFSWRLVLDAVMMPL